VDAAQKKAAARRQPLVEIGSDGRSADLSHDLDCAFLIAFGVDLRRVRILVAKDHLGGVQAELTVYSGRGGMT
jgi:hypothetical protein